MNLEKYFERAPKERRTEMLKSLANAHGRPISTVYKWRVRRNHPVDEKSMAITERWSGFEVTRFDERPDIFCLQGLLKLLKAKGFHLNNEGIELD